MRTKIKTPTLGLVDEVYEVALGDRYRKFYQTLNNAKKNHSIQYSIQFFYELFIQRNYSFKEIIHFFKNYSFKKLFN